MIKFDDEDTCLELRVFWIPEIRLVSIQNGKNGKIARWH